MRDQARSRLRVAPFVAAAAVALAAGIWGGLARAGWSLPGDPVDLVLLHGPLMVLGFLSTLIGLERAVALGALWGFAAPAATALGTVALLAGAPVELGQVAMLAGGLVLLAVLTALLGRARTVPGILLVVAAALAVTGDALWLAGVAVRIVVPWWAAFLVVTIVAERLELAALVRLDRAGRLALPALVGILAAGCALGHVDADTGTRVAAAAHLGLAAWLARYDVARRTVRIPGLPRFVAVALGSGYVWLAFAGGLALVEGSTFGGTHDAAVHALFLGFVVAMVFAHAPIVLPALLGVRLPYRSAFYGHLGLLHAGLAVRVAGDLGDDPSVARAGALTNAAAFAAFVAVTAGSALVAARSTRRLHPSRRGASV